jgi:predicted PurR-regulated permease PerM
MLLVKMRKIHRHIVRLMDGKQRHALSIAVILALLLAIYFLRSYFFVIAIGVIVAYMFNPIYQWLLRKTNNRVGLCITLTFIISVITILIPLSLVLIFTIDQAVQFANELTKSASQGTSFGNFIDQALTAINNLIDKLPGGSVDNISTVQVTDWLQSNASNIAKYVFNFFAGLTGSIIGFLAKMVIYVYVFMSVLRNQDKILYAIRRINPLGERATNLYLKRIGAMTTAMVKGQFAIAILQGLVDASLLWAVGLRYFFLWFVLTTFLSIIPLGGGVAVIPIGIIMLATGHIWQGIVLIAGHILIVTNIDNIVRPKFASKKAYMDSALVILSVFAGLAMFGFVGIVLGPVLMILIVTTIQVYLAAVDNEAEIAAAADSKEQKSS